MRLEITTRNIIGALLMTAVVATALSPLSAQVRSGRRGAVAKGDDATVAAGPRGAAAKTEDGYAAAGRNGAVVSGEEGYAAVGRNGNVVTGEEVDVDGVAVGRRGAVVVGEEGAAAVGCTGLLESPAIQQIKLQSLSDGTDRRTVLIKVGSVSLTCEEVLPRASGRSHMESESPLKKDRIEARKRLLALL